MMDATRLLDYQQGRLCFKKANDSQTRRASIYVGRLLSVFCTFCSSSMEALLLPSHTFLRVGLPAAGLLSDIRGLRMEEEERGCVRVRLVSGWRGALGTGGEEHRLHTAGRRGGGDPAASGGGAVAAVAS